MLEEAIDWLLLPLGAALGWALRGRNPAPRGGGSDALRGLSRLAGDDTDQALSALSRAAEAEPAVLDLQLSIGSLFRRRGETGRAISIHEALLARSDLAADEPDLVRIELAQDYLKAGLMDRAESLLTELVGRGSYLSRALELLLSIYEQGREWDRAIAVAQQLQSVRGTSFANVIAHYYCEQAERALAKDPAEAERLVQRAQAADTQCVRASLLAAQLAEQAQNPEAALRALRRVPDQDPRFIPEILETVDRCCIAAGQERALDEFLEEAEEQHASAALARARAQRLFAKDPTAARAFLAERLARHPDWAGLLLWLDWGADTDPSAASLQALRETLRQRIQQPAIFQCNRCGLRARTFYWQCPSCKNWGSLAATDSA